MSIKYYVVYSKLNNFPEAIFRSEAWADRFIKEQKKIWVNAIFKKYTITEQEFNIKKFLLF